jgi:hypothetical protein
LGNGWYNLAYTTTHTNTKGALALHITATGADPTDLVDEVVDDLPGDSVSSVTGAVGSVTGAVGSVTGNVGGNVVGSVASVTGNVGGNVTGSVGSVASGGITRASFAADTGLQSIRSNTAQAGGSTSITLDSGASATNSFYNNCIVYLTGGTGAGQARFITAYVGATKVATVTAWGTNPDNTSTFAILPFDAIPGATAPTAAQNATAVWQDLLSGSDFTTAGSIGAQVKANVVASVSGAVGSISGVTFPANFSSLVIDGSGRVDVSKISGVAQTGRDVGASVLLSNGTGTGQLSFTAGVVKSDLVQISGTSVSGDGSGTPWGP